MFWLRTCRTGLAFVLALLSQSVTALEFSLPLGFEPPTALPIDPLSTSTEGGDINGPPGINACASAAHDSISLPADDAVHSNSYMDWMWWTGRAVAANGRRIAFIVLYQVKPSLGSQMVHYTITDLQTRRFHQGFEEVRAAAADVQNGHEFESEHVSIRSGDGVDRLTMKLDGYELDVTYRNRKPPSLELGDGYANVYCLNLYLYRRVRMQVAGTLTVDGVRTSVSGNGDFAHNWGFNLMTLAVRTTWITMTLDDGRDIFVARGHESPYTEAIDVLMGALSAKDGRLTPLHRADLSIVPTRSWEARLGCSYPVEWDVFVKGEKFHIRAVLDSTEVRQLDPVQSVVWPDFLQYWDGETIVTDSRGRSIGRGWLDMLRYCYH